MNQLCKTSALIALCSILACVNNLEGKSLHHFGHVRSHGHADTVKLHHEEPPSAADADTDNSDVLADPIDKDNGPAQASPVQDQDLDELAMDAVKLAKAKVANKISRCTPRPQQQQKQGSCGVTSCRKQTTKPPRQECDTCDVSTSCTDGCTTKCPPTTERSTDGCNNKCSTKSTEKSCGECYPTTCATACGSGYYCPTQSCWLPPEALIKSSDPPTPATKWIQGDLLIEKCKATNEYNCLKIQFASQLGVASLEGWSLCGGNSGKSDGHIIQYIVLYRNPTTEQWTTFQEGNCSSPKVFCVDESLEGPTIHMLDKPVIAQEMMLCPLEVTGRHPLLHVRVKGCLLKKHSPIPQTKLPTNAPCCASEEVWLDKDDQLKECMFKSNAGGHAGDAIYSRCGYTFPCMPTNIDENKKYFLEVTFKNPKIVKSLKIMGATIGDIQGTIQRFKVAYKDQKNNCAWAFVREENCDAEKIFATKQLHNYASGYYKASRLPMCPPVVTTGLRIYPQSWCGDRPVLKLDIKACDLKKQDSCCEDDSECKQPCSQVVAETNSDVKDPINSAQSTDDLNKASELAANAEKSENHHQLLARLDSSEEIKALLEDLKKSTIYDDALEADLEASEADLERSDAEIDKLIKGKDDTNENSEIDKRDDSKILFKDSKSEQLSKREAITHNMLVKREAVVNDAANSKDDFQENPKEYAMDADVKTLNQEWNK